MRDDENPFIDMKTRVVFVSFSFYNMNLNMFGVVRLVVEFGATGDVVPTFDVLSSRLLQVRGDDVFAFCLCSVEHSASLQCGTPPLLQSLLTFTRFYRPQRSVVDRQWFFEIVVNAIFCVFICFDFLLYLKELAGLTRVTMWHLFDLIS